MGLLQSLGLPKSPAPGLTSGGADAAADDDAPSRSDGRRPTPSPVRSGKSPSPAPAPSVAEMAKWPSKAHRAWKRLDHVRRTAVAIQMSSLYGQAFMKDFLDAAKSGKTRLEGADFVTALDSQTPDAMKAAGYKLAQRASNGDRAQEWWVRADGFVVLLLRELKKGTKPPTTGPGVTPPTSKQPPDTRKVDPPPPPGKCSKEASEQLDMALQWAADALAEARQAQKDIEAEKARMDKLNVTSKAFEQAYQAMTDRLKDDIAHLESVIADITAAKEALKDSGCNLSKLDTALDELSEELTGAEVAKSLHEMDIRKPIKVDVKDMPDDEE